MNTRIWNRAALSWPRSELIQRRTPATAANFGETVVRGLNSSSATINSDGTVGNASLQNTLFDRAQRARLENGQPRSKINLSAEYGYQIFGLRVGVNNLFDVYPDRLYQDPNNNEQLFGYSALDGTNRGRFPYNAN